MTETPSRHTLPPASNLGPRRRRPAKLTPPANPKGIASPSPGLDCATQAYPGSTQQQISNPKGVASRRHCADTSQIYRAPSISTENKHRLRARINAPRRVAITPGLGVPSQLLQSLPQMRTHRLIIAEADRPFKGSLRVAGSADPAHQVPPRRPIRLVIAQSFLRQGLQQRQTPLGPKSMRARDRMANARPHRRCERNQHLVKRRDDGPFVQPQS